MSTLKRVLGLGAVTFIAIGFTIGGGVFVFTGIVLKMVGAALPLAYALAVVPVFLSMMPLAMLGSAIPTVGGNYKYPSRMVSPGIAFVGIWIYVLATFFGQIPLYSISCAHYISTFYPELSLKMCAIALVTLFYIVNVIGIKPAATVQALMVIILLSALFFFSFSGMARFDSANLANFFEKGTANLLVGTALLTFTYLGSNGIIELGGEIKNPGTTIPKAYFITFPIVTCVYLCVAIATVGAFPWQQTAKEAEPLIFISKSLFGSAGVMFFILGGAVLALTTTLNALFIVGTKSLLIIIQDNLLPSWLGKIHATFGTPHILLTIIWVLSIVGILSGMPIETFASYSALGGIIIFLPILMAALRFPSLYPDKYTMASFKLKGAWLYICVGVGCILIVFFCLVILVDLKTIFNIGLFVVFALSGVVYYIVRKRYLASQGVYLETILQKEEWV
ncbi:MAG: APC family permease [Spirochaetes bacterium]|nr:APC family permease [Spirochaetota bacterium]